MHSQASGHVSHRVFLIATRRQKGEKIPSGHVCRGRSVASGRKYLFLLLHNVAKLSSYGQNLGFLIIIINLEEPQWHLRMEMMHIW